MQPSELAQRLGLSMGTVGLGIEMIDWCQVYRIVTKIEHFRDENPLVCSETYDILCFTVDNDNTPYFVDFRCKSWIQQQLIDCSTHLKKCKY